MIVIETCPKCGHDLVELCYPTFPPKYGKECFNCGWKSAIKQEEVIRVPYNENDVIEENAVLKIETDNKIDINNCIKIDM